jgi:hypothetical protein
MAIHTTLPIYKVTYDLLRVVTEITRHMPRDFKASLGGKIREECVELLVLIFRANTATDKVPHLTELLERNQVAELLLRLCTDMKFISLKHYAAAIELTSMVSKQATGWKKSSAPPPVTSPSRQ